MKLNNKKSLWEIPDDPEVLFKEILVARRASDITAKLVVEQFVKMDSMLYKLEKNIQTEKKLKTKLTEKLKESESRKNELDIARCEAESANKAKSAFLASTSHELRTPLTSILGFAKIIQKRLIDTVFPAIETDNKKVNRSIRQVTDNIGIIVSEGERLTNLINNVLDLAKIESGKTDWNMESVIISELIERSKSATMSLFQNVNIPLILDIPDNLPMVTGDSDQLMQVVINLFSNAVKFTEKGNVTCKVRHINNEIIISVIDTGIGINEDIVDTVFEKFIQIGDTLTNKPKGTGLGLTICKEIINYHKGNISVKSQKGKGSTFYFTLPIISETQEDDIKQKILKEADNTNISKVMKQIRQRVDLLGTSSSNKLKNILVVDDEKHINRFCKITINS